MSSLLVNYLPLSGYFRRILGSLPFGLLTLVKTKDAPQLLSVLVNVVQCPVGEFYAAKGGLLGRRPDCKSCSNSYHNAWARRRYVPKTGRRYLTRRDREAAATAASSKIAL